MPVSAGILIQCFPLTILKGSVKHSEYKKWVSFSGFMGKANLKPCIANRDKP